MYAIIRTGGKQAKVQPGDVLDVELHKGEDEEVDFTPLLVVDDKGKAITGRDDLAAVKVRAKVLGEVSGDKVDIFKYRPKSGYRRRGGHRQRYTRIEITGIELPRGGSGGKAAPKRRETAKPSSAAGPPKTSGQEKRSPKKTEDTQEKEES